MKTLAVLVALAIVIGPETLVVRAAHFSSSKLKEIREFGRRVTHSASSKQQLLRNSKIGEALSDQFNKLFKTLTNLDKHMPGEISEAVRMATDVTGSIMVMTFFSLYRLEMRSQPDFEPVFKALEDYLEPMLVRASFYTEPLLTPVAEKIMELDEKIDEWMTQAMWMMDRQMPFYLKSVEEIRDGLQPLEEEVGRQCQLVMETLNKNLKPYLDPLLKKGREYLYGSG